MRETPKCFRCGRTVPPRRRVLSDYCTDRCAREQQVEDDASAQSEREAQEEAQAAQPFDVAALT